MATARTATAGCATAASGAVTTSTAFPAVAIAVTGAVTEVPTAFLNWLRPGGRLFIIRGQSPAQEALRLTRTVQGFDTESLFETDIPYLVGAQPVDRFSL